MSSNAPSVAASPKSDPEALLWALPVVYAMHIVEEFAFGWANWARGHGLGFTWSEFMLINAAVVVFGVCAAAVGYRRPGLALAFPALMLVNGLLFHLVPTVVWGRPNPGFLTAVLLFLPLGAKCMSDAARSGVARAQLATAFGVAALAQTFPLLLDALRSRLEWTG